MSVEANKPSPVSRTQGLHTLDNLCDAFESQWRGGARPAIEDFLSQSVSGLRTELLEELLALEIAFRTQRGDSPIQEEYVRRFPEFDTSVRRVFTDLAWQQKTTVEQETLAVGVGHRPRPLGEFGAYQLLAEIGRGGMGVVYKAHQPSLDRTVAIKMILAGQSTPQAFVERFRTEAKTLAKLAHPGIVPVFEVGDVGGQHYFSMEYVEGQSLAQQIAAGPMAPRDAARITREVAEVIHFAHEQGVLHRDIKPSNILVSPQGRARVMDFGLAKHVEGDSQTTRSGEVLGTPSYMSPEQASGRWREVDRRSDVYSLGAVLYALLVRRPPFQEDSPLATLLSVVQAQPAQPSSLNPAIEPELERICLKCLDKDPVKRYSTAAALAQDLDRYLNNDPVVVLKSSQTSRKVVRRSWPILVASALVAAFAFGAIVITLQTPHGTLIVDVPDDVAPNLQVRATKDKTVEVVDTESKWKLEIVEGKYNLQLNGGDDQFQITPNSIVVTRNKEARVKITHKAADIAKVQPSAPASVPSSAPASLQVSIPADPLRTFAKQERLGKLALVEHPAEIKDVLSWTIESVTHRAPVTSLAYFPSGRKVVSCGRDGTLRIWDTSNGRMLRVLVSSDELESCDVSHDGQYIAACGHQRLEIWEIESGRQLKTLSLDTGRPLITRWSPDGHQVACAIDRRGVQIWDVVAGKGIDLLPAAESISAMAWNRDGSQIAFSTEKSGVEVYRVETGESLNRLYSPKDRVTSIAWSKDSSQLLVGGACNDAGAAGVRIWSLSKEPMSREITGTGGVVTQVSWQDDDRKLLLVLDNGNGELRDAESGKVVRTYENRNRAAKPTAAVWSPDGTTATSADASGAVTIRATRTGSEIRRAGLAAHYSSPTWNSSMPALAWSPDGNRIVFATPNALDEPASVPGFWQMSGRDSFHAGQGSSRHHFIVSMAWSDDGELLATGGSDPQTIIWNKDGTHRQSIATGGWVTGLGFEPKSHRLAVGTQGGEINLWDLDQKKPKKLASPHKSWVTFRWSNDGKQMISASYDGKLAIWNPETGEAKITIATDGAGKGLGELHCVDVSSDGKFLAAGGLERAWIFGAETGEQVHLLPTGGWTYCLQFSPDGKRLASGSGDGRLRLWTPADGKLEKEILQPGPVMGVTWSPDSRSVACSTPQRASVYQSNGNKQWDLIPLGMTDGVAISPSGHVRAANLDQLVYVLQTAAGQVTVDAKEMEARWGWKNNPQIAQLGK